MERPPADLIQHIRRRPAMYVGSTGGYGLHRLPLILLHAGFVAAREGRGREQRLHLEASGACTFTFDGLLCPVQLAPSAEAFERLLTPPASDTPPRLPDGAPVPPVQGTVEESLALLNALSSELEFTVWTEAGAWRQRFRCGRPVESLCSVPRDEELHASPVGTCLRFVPDGTLFERIHLSGAGLAERMEQLAGLQPGLTCHLRDDVRGQQVRFRYEGGLADWLARLTEREEPLHAPWVFEGRHEGTHVRLALQWTRRRGAGALSWVNTLRAHRGTHLEGFTSGLHLASYDFAKSVCRNAEFCAYIPEVLTEGLTALLDVTVARPVWYGPIKGNLANEEVDSDVTQLVRGWLRAAFAEHPATAEQVLDLIAAHYVARG